MAGNDDSETLTLGPYLEPRLDELCEVTCVSQTLLNRLQLFGIIKDGTKATIFNVRGNSKKAAEELYAFLSTKAFSPDIEKIITILDITNNKHAVQILREIFPKNEKKMQEHSQIEGIEGYAETHFPVYTLSEDRKSENEAAPNGDSSKGLRIVWKVVNILTNDDQLDDDIAFLFAKDLGFPEIYLLRFQKRLRFCDYVDGVLELFHVWISHFGTAHTTLGAIIKALKDVGWKGPIEKIENEDWQKILEGP